MIANLLVKKVDSYEFLYYLQNYLSAILQIYECSSKCFYLMQ